MIPVKSLVSGMAIALAAAPPLAQATALNRIALIMAPFTPSPNLTYADLVLATFTGSAPKVVPLGTQQAGIDPVTGQNVITIVEPAGGWRFQATDTVNLPQSIFGFALFDSTGPGPLIATELLAVPVTLTAALQEINLGTAKLTLVLSPLS